MHRIAVVGTVGTDQMHESSTEPGGRRWGDIGGGGGGGGGGVTGITSLGAGLGAGLASMRNVIRRGALHCDGVPQARNNRSRSASPIGRGHGHGTRTRNTSAADAPPIHSPPHRFMHSSHLHWEPLPARPHTAGAMAGSRTIGAGALLAVGGIRGSEGGGSGSGGDDENRSNRNGS